MYAASKTTFDDFYCPNGLNSIDTNKNFANGAHTTQHFRANLRATNPPYMFLDDAILAAGLEGNEMCTMDYEVQTPQPSPPYTETYFLTEEVEEYEGNLQGADDWEDGIISPLELPPRLLNFELTDGGNSDFLLLGPEPPLDLEELDRRLELIARVEEPQGGQVNFDRRLESIARIERLQKAGLLDAFFTFANATYP